MNSWPRQLMSGSMREPRINWYWRVHRWWGLTRSRKSCREIQVCQKSCTLLLWKQQEFGGIVCNLSWWRWTICKISLGRRGCKSSRQSASNLHRMRGMRGICRQVWWVPREGEEKRRKILGCHQRHRGNEHILESKFIANDSWSRFKLLAGGQRRRGRGWWLAVCRWSRCSKREWQSCYLRWGETRLCRKRPFCFARKRPERGWGTGQSA